MLACYGGAGACYSRLFNADTPRMSVSGAPVLRTEIVHTVRNADTAQCPPLETVCTMLDTDALQRGRGLLHRAW